jgi:nucleotide-binding universal stress UspA family protein
MKTILLMTDFSENAKNAIKYAINMFGEEVEYLLLNTYIVRENTGSFMSVADQIKDISEKEMAKEEAFIKKEFSSLSKLNVKPLLIRGEAIGGVNLLKKEKQIDLIVMGTKGASGITKFLVGSVTASVVQGTGLPVLIIPEKEQYQAYKKIVFATDFTHKVKQEILTPLQQIAQKFNAEIAMLNVLDENNIKNEKVLDTSNLFGGVKSYLDTIKASERDVIEDIELYCKNNKAEMLTVVAHHNTFFQGLFHKSVSQELIYHAQLPILALDDSFNN